MTIPDVGSKWLIHGEEWTVLRIGSEYTDEQSDPVNRLTLITLHRAEPGVVERMPIPFGLFLQLAKEVTK